MLYSRGKYVVGELQGLLQALVFNECTDHATVARAFDPGTVRSAGFFNLSVSSDDTIKVWPHGESIGLKLSSDPEKDEIHLQRALSIFNR